MWVCQEVGGGVLYAAADIDVSNVEPGPSLALGSCKRYRHIAEKTKQCHSTGLFGACDATAIQGAL